MGEFDFEAEARAWCEADYERRGPFDGSVRKLAAKLAEVDARARAEGKADGYRRGVEAVAKLCAEYARDGRDYKEYASDVADELESRARTLLPPEPAKAETSDAIVDWGESAKAEPSGTIVDWGGVKMRVGRCPPGDTCLSCDRLGSHLERLQPEPAKAECKCYRSYGDDPDCPIRSHRARAAKAPSECPFCCCRHEYAEIHGARR